MIGNLLKQILRHKVRSKGRYRIVLPKENNTLSIVQTLLSILTAVLTIYVAFAANMIIESQNQILVDQRRLSVRPIIQVTSKSGPDSELDQCPILIKNVGSGVATGIFVVAQPDSGGCEVVCNEFWKYNGNLDFSGDRQRYLEKGEEVYFVSSVPEIFGIDAYLKLPARERFDKLMDRTLTLYVSYFDIDGWEYLTVFKSPALNLANSALVVSDSSVSAVLSEYGKSVARSSGRTFVGTSLRDSTGWFKKDDK